ncbi:MAG: right-handed parallel beta-helix repeat-containing protein [Acidiferrobacter sp.]
MVGIKRPSLNTVVSLKKLLLPVAIAASLTACVSGGAGSASGSPSSPGVQPSSNTTTSIPITGSSIPMGLALVTPGAGTGQTYYVATTGSDSNNGLSPQTPFLTIQHAIETVGPGGTVEIMGGTYTGGITIDHPGTAAGWIIMEPYQNQQVIIDGSNTMDDVFFYNSTGAPTYWEMKGLTIVNAQQYTVQISVPDVKLVDNDISGSADDLVKLVQAAHNVVVWGNQVHNNNAAPGTNAQGIDMVGSQNVLVAHNNVYNIASIGMYCKGNAGNITFEDNTLNNIYSRGIMLGESTGVQYLLPGKTYESYNSIVKNNVITNDQSACLAESSSYNAEIYNNSCYNTAIARHGAIMISNESALGQAATNVYIRNNIIYNLTNRPTEVIAPKAMTDYTTLHIDHNMYYNPNGVTFEWDDKNIYGMAFATWQQTTGLDKSSIVANPLYANTSTLTVSANSPALNAGIVLPSVMHDFNGVVRPTSGSYDLGAYQSSQ